MKESPPEFGAGAVRLRLPDGPLDLGWHHCGMTSDFLSAFFATGIVDSRIDTNEARHNMRYLVNEVLENAVKFRSAGDIVIESLLAEKDFRLCVSNAIEKDVALRFQDMLAGIEGRDPQELLIERIERNAVDSTSSGSGLGLLTLMSDYGVRMGWNFHENEDRESTRVDTHAVLALA